MKEAILSSKNINVIFISPTLLYSNSSSYRLAIPPHPILFDQNESYELIDFVPIDEPWNYLNLADGNGLKFRLVVSEIRKYDQVNELGEPIYLVNSQPTISRDLKVRDMPE
jgi:hypothetical protein